MDETGEDKLPASDGNPSQIARLERDLAREHDLYIRQDLDTTGDVLYFRAHGRNAKKWWHAKESSERYDYLYSRAEVQEHAQKIKTAVRKPTIKAAFGVYNNHARANAAANAIMLAQELGVRLTRCPPKPCYTSSLTSFVNRVSLAPPATPNHRYGAESVTDLESAATNQCA